MCKKLIDLPLQYFYFFQFTGQIFDFTFEFVDLISLFDFRSAPVDEASPYPRRVQEKIDTASIADNPLLKFLHPALLTERLLADTAELNSVNIGVATIDNLGCYEERNCRFEIEL